ncbi:MAG TPA: transporter substrate-binding domain-containing protein [Aliidongia sp.]|nr:transporter substrate-binding domain-containing protein [Aliidongia sp.]
MVVPSRTARALAQALACLLVLAAFAIAAPGARADEAPSPDTALARLLDEARAGIPGACAAPDADRLVRVLCAGSIRVGVRADYPLFAAGAVRSGYEIDLARAIADRLGVGAELATVKSSNRIALLAEDRIDVAIATMGHTTLRDGQARFVRPHYYRSETVLVGPRELAVTSWADVAGRTVCVTIGNGSNAELSSHGARLMLFESPEQLLDRLRADACSLIAQDDSFFAASFADPAFASLYDRKLGFAPVPWGMAVAQAGGERLARALALTSQIFHRDGVFLDIARANHIATGFFEEQQAIWHRPECDTATGSANPSCVLPPLASDLGPTRVADRVAAAEAWLSQRTGITLSLPMLKTMPAWRMFRTGLINSLVLVAGAIASTLAFALAFGAALGARERFLRLAVRLLTVALQSSPIVLTLVIAAALANAIASYSSPVALAASILALGLTNGSYAGQAISEATLTLRAEAASDPAGGRDLFLRAVRRSATQIMAFVINATKGTPIASFIGAPELLSALTDISSFSSERATTYWILLIFYTAVVILVVWLCTALRSFLERRGVPT